MKKIFLIIFLFLIYLFFFFPVVVFAEVGGCSITYTPSQPVDNQPITITVTRSVTSGPEQNYRFIDYHNGVKQREFLYPLPAGQPRSFPLGAFDPGINDLTICKPSGSLCDASDKCGTTINIKSATTTATTTSGGSDALKNPPKDWLKTVNPGFPAPWGANFGLDFFTKQLVPFLVWAGVFFTIILSLIFLLVGGIMWITGGGNKEGMAKAKATVTYALVGLVLGLSSVIILRFLENFFKVSP